MGGAVIGSRLPTSSDAPAFLRGEEREPQAKLFVYHVNTLNTGVLLPMAALPFPHPPTYENYIPLGFGAGTLF